MAVAPFLASILTVSDGVTAGSRKDESGAALAELLEAQGYRVVSRRVVPDDVAEIARALEEMSVESSLVVTTGGTGFGPRDVTPEATRSIIEREATGLVTLMLTEGIKATPMASLSRAVAGTRGRCLIINLPGSPRGATENLTALLPVLPHALTLLGGNTEHSADQ
ncbi:MAG: MogA/MoaB family molybdenum cofactor biosynthesis protein [Acidimicrobiia bacterium]